jgi:hypothetical protein
MTLGLLTVITLAIIGAVVFLKLGALPGARALERGRPQAEAINILGSFGLILGAVPWVVALVWASTVPRGADERSSRESTKESNHEIQ